MCYMLLHWQKIWNVRINATNITRGDGTGDSKKIMANDKYSNIEIYSKWLMILNLLFINCSQMFQGRK